MHRALIDRVLNLGAVGLVVALVLVYGAVKLHFYTQFDPRDLRGYAAAHWPFWAGLRARWDALGLGAPYRTAGEEGL